MPEETKETQNRKTQKSDNPTYYGTHDTHTHDVLDDDSTVSKGKNKKKKKDPKWRGNEQRRF